VVDFMEDISSKVTNYINKHDKLIELFNMKIQESRPGYAKVVMKVGKNHLNAANLCHGAALFALADVAFALAVNCYGQMALAIEASMNYFRPVKPGEEVVAICEELFQGKRTGSYQATVLNGAGKKVAFFKATAFRINEMSVGKHS